MTDYLWLILLGNINFSQNSVVKVYSDFYNMKNIFIFFFYNMQNIFIFFNNYSDFYNMKNIFIFFYNYSDFYNMKNIFKVFSYNSQ